MTDSKDQNPPKTPKPPKPPKTPKTPETTGTTKKPENWLLQKIKENPFQFFWSLGLTLGGAILIIFFLQMGFMPDMNFPEALDIFIATASIGLLIVFPMFLAIMPAILTRAFYFTKKTYGNGGLLTVNTFLAFGVVICFIQNYMAIAILICLFIFFIYLGCLCYDLYQEKQQKDNKQISDNYEKILIYIPCAAIWSIYPIILFKLFFNYGGFHQEKWLGILFLTLWLILSYVISYIIINHKDKQEVKLYFFGTFLIFVIFYILTGALIRIPSAAVELLGLGERQVSVLLKKEGCDIFNAISKSTGEGEICKGNSVDSIYLKSRIASPYVFEKHKEIKKEEDSKKKEENKVLWRITIPKEYVVSLILQKQNSGQSIGSQSSDSSAQNNQLPDSSSPNKTPAQTSPEKCLTTCCMCCVPAASCHIPPNCPSKAKQESESRAQPC